MDNNSLSEGIARIVALASIQVLTGVHLNINLLTLKTVKVIDIVLEEQAKGNLNKHEVDAAILNEYNIIALDNNLETIDFIGLAPFSLN